VEIVKRKGDKKVHDVTKGLKNYDPERRKKELDLLQTIIKGVTETDQDIIDIDLFAK